MVPFTSFFGPNWFQGYVARVRKCFEITDMRTLFVTKADLNHYMHVLENAKDYTPEEVEYAMKVRDSMIHPDTKDVIPLPFRMSAAVPMNIVIVAGMLTAQSLSANLFFQFVNQSYNTCVNYANRNASNQLSNQQLLQAYGGATGAAMATSFLMDKAVPVASKFRKFSPFIAVAVASAANVYLMRRNETVEGVSIYDKKGTYLGKSPEAGKLAIIQTAITRVLTAFPVMVLPPATYMAFRLQDRIKSKVGNVLVNASLVGLGMFVFLPLTLAVFPQTMEIDTKNLEPHFASKVHNQNERVIVNRGL
ncbi:mitochondrial tricarboxylate carrier protein (sideroflexin) [Andalucia godoyi]|uniref:Mitochondrial tricarboxylate carrier protein (Sideroflexin) n=1 Tax=Andalucia godoyi TaxID=505711 RepID=A0A8K0F2L7_ANDGO|nr:mitochondrial tricarboxylate carrier protein (sideroflexin) [Andalucia godoyi]|eukprot:ANDGO_05841.mRNA.1 mitochondrial tricarboxylate carrier protein (sideroflexin)